MTAQGPNGPLGARRSAHGGRGKKSLGEMISPGFFYFQGDSIGEKFVGDLEFVVGVVQAVELVLLDL